MRVLFIDARFKPPAFGLTTIDYAKCASEAIELFSNNSYDVVSIGNSLLDNIEPLTLMECLLDDEDKTVSIFNFHGTNSDKISSMINLVSEKYRFEKVDVHTVGKHMFSKDGDFMLFVNTARNHYAAREILDGDHVKLQKGNLFYNVYPEHCIKYNKRKPEEFKTLPTTSDTIETKISEGFEVIYNPFTDLTNFTKVRRTTFNAQ